MKIKELLEDADVIDFRSGVHDLKNRNTRSTDPRTHRQITDIKKRATAKSHDLELANLRKVDSIKGHLHDTYLRDMFYSYIRTAIWSSCFDTDSGEFKVYSEQDISAETMEKMLNMCRHFLTKAGDLVKHMDADEVGHNFWLTQNHHGAGFWDGNYPEDIQDRLTEISKTFPEVNLYSGDDGLLHAG